MMHCVYIFRLVFGYHIKYLIQFSFKFIMLQLLWHVVPLNVEVQVEVYVFVRMSQTQNHLMLEGVLNLSTKPHVTHQRGK